MRGSNATDGRLYFAFGGPSDHGVPQHEWLEFEQKLGFLKMLGDACVRASKSWPQLTRDFEPLINSANKMDYFSQVTEITLEMVTNIGLTTRQTNVIPYDDMVKTWGDTWMDSTGIQRGTTSVPDLKGPGGCSKV